MSSPVPQGASTLLEILDHAAAAGYGGQLAVADAGNVRCHSCENTSRAERLDVAQIARLEGATDAADELLVVLASCPACGADGTLTIGYGPNATAADAAALEALDMPAPGAVVVPDAGDLEQQDN